MDISINKKGVKNKRIEEGEKNVERNMFWFYLFFFSLVESWWNRRRRRKWLEFYEYLICIYSDCKLFEIMNFNNKFSYTLLFSFFLSLACVFCCCLFLPRFSGLLFYFFIFFLVASFWCKFLSPSVKRMLISVFSSTTTNQLQYSINNIYNLLFGL